MYKFSQNQSETNFNDPVETELILIDRIGYILSLDKIDCYHLSLSIISLIKVKEECKLCRERRLMTISRAENIKFSM